MVIRVAGGLLHIGGDAVRYDGRLSASDVMRLVVGWRGHLEALFAFGRTTFLPFSIDEEAIEAFEAELGETGVQLRVVTLDAMGYVPGVDPLSEAFDRVQTVVERREREFANCEPSSLLGALVALAATLED